MFVARPQLHFKDELKKFTALCGRVTFFMTDVKWKVTCNECKQKLNGKG